MFEKIKRHLAKRLLPYAEVTPPKYETISSKIVGLHAEITINLDMLPVGINPVTIHKREIANLLKEALIDYIRFETNEDCPGCIRYRGSIRIVDDRS